MTVVVVAAADHDESSETLGLPVESVWAKAHQTVSLAVVHANASENESESENVSVL